jgi:hypothetical protein
MRYLQGTETQTPSFHYTLLHLSLHFTSHFTLLRITSHHFTSHHITLHHITSPLTSLYFTSLRFTSHFTLHFSIINFMSIYVSPCIFCHLVPNTFNPYNSLSLTLPGALPEVLKSTTSISSTCVYL